MGEGTIVPPSACQVDHIANLVRQQFGRHVSAPWTRGAIHRARLAMIGREPVEAVGVVAGMRTLESDGFDAHADHGWVPVTCSGPAFPAKPFLDPESVPLSMGRAFGTLSKAPLWP